MNETSEIVTPPTHKKPSKKTLPLLLTAVIAFSLVFAYVYSNNNKVAAPAVIKAPQLATVRVTPEGFQPQALKVKSGTTVVWTNYDTKPHRVASNPDLAHKDLPELDSKTNFDTNGTYRFTFEKPGTYGYHDELNPEINGTIIVE
jgi:plastocyanin